MAKRPRANFMMLSFWIVFFSVVMKIGYAFGLYLLQNCISRAETWIVTILWEYFVSSNIN